MEKKTYRLNLERLNELRPDGELIPLGGAAKLLGCDIRTLQSTKAFPSVKVGRLWMVSKANLANWMAG